MRGIVLPVKKDKQKLGAPLQRLVDSVASLEELFVALFDRLDSVLPQNLTCSVQEVTALNCDPERNDTLSLLVSFDKKTEFMIALPLVDQVHGRKLFTPGEGVASLSDKQGGVIDDEWFRERDKRFGIRELESDWSSTAVIASAKVAEVVLSYAVRKDCFATIHLDYYETLRKGTNLGLHMKLVSILPLPRGGLVEHLVADLSDLDRYVRRHKQPRVAA